MSRMAEIINRALLTKSMKVVSSVYETKDYSIFKELEDNRDITKARVEKLVASFSEKEILNPIVVNEKMEIVDGQGRYEALKRLGRSIKFLVSPGATIEDCRRMNAYNQKWTNMEFVKSFASSGDVNYINLMECRKITNLSFDMILRLANQSTHIYFEEEGERKFTLQKIKTGKIKFTDFDKNMVVRTYGLAIEIKEALQLSCRLNGAFYTAVKVMVGFYGYDHQRMIEKCKLYKHKFTQMANLENALKEFSEAYNYHAKSNNKLYFEDYMRNKGMRVKSYTTNTSLDLTESVKTLGGKNE